MPYLNLKIGAPRSALPPERAASFLLEATRRILGKDPALTAVAIDYVAPDQWFVGGRSLAEQRKSSFYLDIRVTDETNTKDEKARYIAAVFEGFAGLLPDLHEESYVHVIDARAAAYGFGGKTQEFRYHRKSLEVSASS